MSGPVSGQASGSQSNERRIEELIAALEALDDPRGREQAKELLQVVLDLHGAGLARLLEIVADAGDAGRSIVETLALDEQSRAILLLHGLHPHDLASRVRQAVDKMRGLFGAQGIKIEVLSASEEAVRLKLSGNVRNKHAKLNKGEIEQAIFALAPEIAAIEIEGLPDANVHEIKFMPASALRGEVARSGS
ncbi:MAG: NifU family protein [Pseudomonadota bacterium]|nr:NifU family protein [Pseudomonadota bacterium]